MTCEAMKGFLTQGVCGAPAATQCSHCARTMCTAHLSPATGFSMCFDCAATQQPQQQQQDQTATDYDDTWAHGYRTSYYASTGYRGSSYDRGDVRSFDERGSNALDDEHPRDGFDAS